MSFCSDMTHGRARTWLWCLLAILAQPGIVAGAEPQDPEADPIVSAAVVAAREEVRAQTAALNEVRDRLGKKRVLHANRLETLSGHVASLRRELASLETVRRERAASVAALTGRMAALDESCAFVRMACREYRRGVAARGGQASMAHTEARFEALDAQLDSGAGADGLAALVEQLLDESESWNRLQLGGAILPGQAADTEGRVHEGTFLCVGPQSWFMGEDGSVGGIVMTRAGSVVAGIHAFETSELTGLQAALGGRAAALPMDVSDGDAFKVVEANPSLAEQWQSGGFVMYPLALVGAAALLLTLLKGVSLGRMDVDPVFPSSTGLEALEQLREGARAPLSPLLDEALVNREAPRAHLEELLAESVASQVPLFERHLGTLAVLGGVAPLLGLLGTVTGMIHTFQLVTSLGTGNARLLSGGISEALTTTKFGLAIAIPILLVHAFLARRARVKLSTLEHTAARVVNVMRPRGRREET